MAIKTQLAKTDIPSAVAYEDEANTFSATQTFSTALQLGASSAPSSNGQIGYNGTEIIFREGGANKKIASTDTAPSYSALQTYTAGVQINTFTPTVNGQIGYDGTNLLFREGGTNKVLVSTGSVNTFSALQTYSAGVQFGSFTPTVNGQIGYDGVNLLFREGGVNKTIGTGGGTTNVYTRQSGNSTSVAQSVSTGLHSFALNTTDLPVGRSLKIIFTGMYEIGAASNSGSAVFTTKFDGDTRAQVRTDLEASNATNKVQWSYSLLVTRAPDATDQKVAIVAELHSTEHTGGAGGGYVDSQVYVNSQGAGPSGYEDIILDSSVTIQPFILFTGGSANVTVHEYQTVAYIV